MPVVAVILKDSERSVVRVQSISYGRGNMSWNPAQPPRLPCRNGQLWWHICVLVFIVFADRRVYLPNLGRAAEINESGVFFDKRGIIVEPDCLSCWNTTSNDVRSKASGF